VVAEVSATSRYWRSAFFAERADGVEAAGVIAVFRVRRRYTESEPSKRLAVTE